MSRHHCVLIKIIMMLPRIIKYCIDEWNQAVTPAIVINTLVAAKIGHGLGFTIW